MGPLTKELFDKAIQIIEDGEVPQGNAYLMSPEDYAAHINSFWNEPKEASVETAQKDALLEALNEIGTATLPKEVAEGIDFGKIMPVTVPQIPEGDWVIEPDGNAYPPEEYTEEEVAVVPGPKPKFKVLKKEAKVKDEPKVPKTKTFKADKLVNGFMLQSNPLAEGKEPFYVEAYLLGADEFYISGGLTGTLNLEEMKLLRKNLKFLIDQMKNSYPNTEIEKGGKAILKVDAPWVPNALQLEQIKAMIGKEMKKFEDVETDWSPHEIVYDVTKTVLSQLMWSPHDEETLVPAPMEVVGNTTDDVEALIKE